MDFKGQWFRCFIGLHKRVQCENQKVKNFRGEEVGINLISRCENCGKIFTKFVSKSIENIQR